MLNLTQKRVNPFLHSDPKNLRAGLPTNAFEDFQDQGEEKDERGKTRTCTDSLVNSFYLTRRLAAP